MNPQPACLEGGENLAVHVFDLDGQDVAQLRELSERGCVRGRWRTGVGSVGFEASINRVRGGGELALHRRVGGILRRSKRCVVGVCTRAVSCLLNSHRFPEAGSAGDFAYFLVSDVCWGGRRYGQVQRWMEGGRPMGPPEAHGVEVQLAEKRKVVLDRDNPCRNWRRRRTITIRPLAARGPGILPSTAVARAQRVNTSKYFGVCMKSEGRLSGVQGSHSHTCQIPRERQHSWC